MQFFRDLAKGWFGKILFGFIICMFVFWGAESIVQFSKSEVQAAAEVNGEKISKAELEENTARQKEVLERQMQGSKNPSPIDPVQLKSDVLQAMIEREVLRQFVADEKMVVSKMAVDRWVSSMPQFQQDGVFSQSLFERSIKQIGLTSREFMREISSDYVLNQLRQSVVDSEFVTDFDLKFILGLEKQTRDAEWLVIEKKQYIDQQQVSEEEIRRFYEQNRAQFKKEEKATFSYITLRPADYFAKVTVTPEEIQAQYQKQIAALKDHEERRSAHILFEVKKDATKDEKKKAEEKAQQVLAELKSGADFSALAKKYSEDLGSATSGGDLGFASRGAFEESFENALFSLKTNEISEVIESSYGFHIIQLLEAKKAEIPTFEAEKESLVATLQAQKAESLYQEELESVRAAAFESGDLTPVAEKFKKKIEKSGWVGRALLNEKTDAPEQDAPAIEDIFQDAAVLKAAFSQEVIQDGYNSELIEVNPQLSVLLHRNEYQSADERPLDEVKDEVVLLLKDKKATEFVQSLGIDALAKLKSQTQAEVAKALSLTWKSEKLSRFGSALPREVGSDIFAAPRPETAEKPTYLSATSDGSDVYIIAIKAVSDNQSLQNADELKQIKKFMARQKGQETFERFVENLVQEADVEKKTDIVSADNS